MTIKWNFNRTFSFKDEQFAKIYRFYVIETPVRDVSARGKTFKSLEINMKSLNAALKRETPFLKELWFEPKQKEVESFCKTEGILDKVDLSREIAIHTLNGKHCSGKTDSLFYAIRCAFAHGSFDIHKMNGDIYYILENRDGGKLKARMILRQDTLLKWIEILESSSEPDSNGKGRKKKR